MIDPLKIYKKANAFIRNPLQEAQKTIVGKLLAEDQRGKPQPKTSQIPEDRTKQNLVSASNWFNVTNTEAGSNKDTSKYWRENEDITFYLVQAATTKTVQQTTAVTWKFICAPQSINTTKSAEYQTENNWASAEKTLVYGGTSMRGLQLSDILIEGLSTQMDITPTLKNLEKLLDPVQYKSYIAPMVFELVARTKGSTTVGRTSRSYGFFVIADLSIDELLRDKKGKPVRCRASMSLLEVPKYQINNGRDLTLPDNLVVKIDKTAKEELDSDKEKGTDGKSAKDTETSSNNKVVDYTPPGAKKPIKVKEVTTTGKVTKDGVTFDYINRYDAKTGQKVGPTEFTNIKGNGTNESAVNKYTQNNKLLEPYVNQSTTTPRK